MGGRMDLSICCIARPAAFLSVRPSRLFLGLRRCAATLLSEGGRITAERLYRTPAHNLGVVWSWHAAVDAGVLCRHAIVAAVNQAPCAMRVANNGWNKLGDRAEVLAGHMDDPSKLSDSASSASARSLERSSSVKSPSDPVFASSATARNSAEKLPSRLRSSQAAPAISPAILDICVRVMALSPLNLSFTDRRRSGPYLAARKADLFVQNSRSSATRRALAVLPRAISSTHSARSLATCEAASRCSGVAEFQSFIICLMSAANAFVLSMSRMINPSALDVNRQNTCA